MKTKNEQIHFTFTEKQGEAYESLSNPALIELLYGGAKGGGKSYFGCLWCYTKAKIIMKKFNLQPVRYPPVIGYMCRKVATDFNGTTLETWKKAIPEKCYEIRVQQKLIIIEKTVAIRYGGLDENSAEIGVNKLNSAEFIFAFVDQAEEITQDDIGLIRGTLRMKIKDKEPDYKILLTANPRSPHWLKDEFIEGTDPKLKFIQALPADNSYLPKSYIATLERAFSFNQGLLDAYLHGSWDDLDSSDRIIREKDVKRNIGNIQPEKNGIKKITVCDVAEHGDDETVIYDMIDEKIIRESIEIYKHKDLMDTVGRIMFHARGNDSSVVCVDVVGLGAGVYSRLCETYIKRGDPLVYGFDGREKAIDNITYANKRTETAFNAARLFADGKCDIPDDPVLKKQLGGLTFHYRVGRMILDETKVLKKHLKSSPDRAFAFIMGLDALQYANIERKRSGWAEDRHEEVADYPYTDVTC